MIVMIDGCPLLEGGGGGGTIGMMHVIDIRTVIMYHPNNT